MELVTRATHGRPRGQEPPAKRPCRECSAPIANLNPSDICAGCNGGTWETPDATDRQQKALQVGRLEDRLVA